MMTVEAIPTLYGGQQFRSRLEADMACLLDALCLVWEYEPQSFLLENGVHYRPDFWLPQLRMWVECRGYESEVGDKQIKGFADRIVGPEQYLVVGPKCVTLWPYCYFPVALAVDLECLHCDFVIGYKEKCSICGRAVQPDDVVTELLWFIQGKLRIGQAKYWTASGPASVQEYGAFVERFRQERQEVAS